MKLGILLIVVAFQILVFQFLGVRLSRQLPDYLIGNRALSSETVAGIARYRDRIGRGRRWIGGALLAILGLAAFGLGGLVVRKLLVAGVSLVSAAAFLTCYARDRRRVQDLATGLPAPGVRRATLERAGLSRHYRMEWEVIPLVVWIGTLMVTAAAMYQGGAPGLLGLPLLQSGVVIGGFVFSLWYARSGPRLSQRARAHLGDPETAFQLDLRLRTLGLRALLAARVGVILLLAANQAGQALPALGLRVPIVLSVIEWGLTVGLLAIFAAYVVGLTRVPAPGRGARDASLSIGAHPGP